MEIKDNPQRIETYRRELRFLFMAFLDRVNLLGWLTLKKAWKGCQSQLRMFANTYAACAVARKSNARRTVKARPGGVNGFVTKFACISNRLIPLDSML